MALRTSAILLSSSSDAITIPPQIVLSLNSNIFLFIVNVNLIAGKLGESTPHLMEFVVLKY